MTQKTARKILFTEKKFAYKDYYIYKKFLQTKKKTKSCKYTQTKNTSKQKR